MFKIATSKIAVLGCLACFVAMQAADCSDAQDSGTGTSNSKQAQEQADLESPPMLEDLMLFYPSKHPEGNWKPDNLNFEDVWITSEDKTRIHAWYCPVKQPRAVLLYVHGNAGNLAGRAELMSYLQNQLKVTTLIFDYRGYGRSDGRPSTRGAIADARAAAKYLAKRESIDGSKLVLMGRSLGGAIAIQLAPEFQPRGLVIESSFSSLKDIASHHYPKLAWVVAKNKLNSKLTIAKYKGPLLQSHGTHDRTVPIAFGSQIFAAANNPKKFIRIANATHNDALPLSYYKELDTFIEGLPK